MTSRSARVSTTCSSGTPCATPITSNRCRRSRSLCLTDVLGAQQPLGEGDDLAIGEHRAARARRLLFGGAGVVKGEGELGVADVLHMVSHLEALSAAERQRPEAVHRALAEVALPCLFNTLTTAAALLSLSLASVQVTRDFGQLAALGVVFAYLYTLCAFNRKNFGLSGYKT